MGAGLFPEGVPRTKRILDLVLTIPGLLLISPLLGIIALWIRLRMGSPVLFRQVRPGLRAKPFTLYKFRTMVDARDIDGRVLSDGARVTGLGRAPRSLTPAGRPAPATALRGA